MVGNIQMHIKSMNFGYWTDLGSANCQYFNEYASFEDEHTIKLKKVN